MIIFLAIFFLFGGISTVLKFSLIEKKSLLFIAAALVIAFCLITYPFALKENNQSLRRILNNKGLITSISSFQILESFLLIILSIHQIKGHYSNQKKWLINLLSTVPSFVFLSGLFFMQLYLFLFLHNISYEGIAVIYAVGTGTILLIAISFLNRFISWELRAELQLLMSLFQILLAMFLPIIVDEIQIPHSSFDVDFKAILLLSATVLFFAAWGFIRFTYIKNKFKFRLW